MNSDNKQLVVSVAEMRAADKRTIENGTPSKELMQRAAQGVFDVGEERELWGKRKILVVCGSGNNGGDGYALAEILHAHRYDVALLRVSEKFSEDGSYYYARCMEAGVRELCLPEGLENKKEVFRNHDVIVDCILGTGFTGVPREAVADTIAAINEARNTGAYIVSVDINSGMNGDTGEAEIAVKSDLTISIGFFKQGFFQEEAKEYVRELVNVDIGICFTI